MRLFGSNVDLEEPEEKIGEEMTTIPQGYTSQLSLYDTQRAIERIKHIFLAKMCAALHLVRVTAPLVVDPTTGLNDNLNGVERPVGFDVPAVGADAEVVQSLAKWKRYALKRYDFNVGKGIVCDMNAIRRDEELDNLHSIYVDQWDWEKVITSEQRTEEYLHEVVRRIVTAVCGTLDELKWYYPQLEVELSRDISFITAQELEDLYPELDPREREHRFVSVHRTAFIQGVGAALRSGKPHDGRSPDYDDWALNGDLLFWDDVLNCPLEASSMGIRVSPESLDRQLTIAGCDDRRELPFHKALLAGELPATIGGGIGQSRLCMLLLGKAHVGEVQASVWDTATVELCREAEVALL